MGKTAWEIGVGVRLVQRVKNGGCGGLPTLFPVEFLFRRTGGDLYGFLTALTRLARVPALVIFVYHGWSLRTVRRHGAEGNLGLAGF